MNLQMEKSGSWRKAGVCAPIRRAEKPDPAFKAPTYVYRDSSILTTRQGGSQYPAFAGLLTFMVMIVNLVRKFFSNRVKVLLVRTKIEKLWRFRSPVKDVLNCCFFSINPLSIGVVDGVCLIETKNLCKFFLPPR